MILTKKVIGNVNFRRNKVLGLQMSKIMNHQRRNENNLHLPLFIEADRSVATSTPIDTEDLSAPKPFVKWVGGKRSLLNEIFPRFPKEFNDYYEPFVGGGAVFFSAYDKFTNAFLSDTNLDLVITYRIIQ